MSTDDPAAMISWMCGARSRDIARVAVQKQRRQRRALALHPPAMNSYAIGGFDPGIGRAHRPLQCPNSLPGYLEG